MQHYDVLIIGAGAAGMAAALAAEKKGYERILLAERKEQAGGVLLQCVHRGFGLGFFREDITGVEYASRFRDMLRRSKAELRCGMAVLKVNTGKTALLSGRSGIEEISFERCIFATGCRERTIYSLGISGTRPAGIMTCGTAQKLINIDRLDIGDNIVILGSGDVGQIVARQLIMSGKNVKAMIEKEDHPGGLKRNQEQCIKAFNIPLALNSEVVWIHGEKRIRAVTVRHNDTGTEEEIGCDTLLTAIGMIPEMELAEEIKVSSALPGWAAAVGNCDYVHDIVDSVTADAMKLFDLREIK